MTFRVSALLLAAGTSRRMGRPKQLLELDGRPAVSTCLSTIAGAGVRDTVVVIGNGGDEIRRIAEGFGAKVAENLTPGSEMAQSVRVGLAEIRPDATGVLICLCDHPLVAKETIGLLCEAHARGPGEIIVPRFRGRKGHPTLFPRRLLEAMEAPLALRDVMEGNASSLRLLEVDDEGTVIDMDTLEDYREIVRRIGAGAGK